MSWALVQTASGTNDASAFGIPIVASGFPGNVTSGNLLVAAVVWDYSNAGYADSSSVTDSRGNTWTYANSASAFDTTNFQASKLYYAIANATGSLSVSGNWTVDNSQGVTFMRIIVSEFSGNSTTPFDSASGRFNSVGSTNVDGVLSQAITPSQAGSLIFSATEDSIGAGTWSPGTGYEKIGTATDLSTEWFEQAVAASISGKWTYGSSHANTTHVAAFKPLVAGGWPAFQGNFKTLMMAGD